MLRIFLAGALSLITLSVSGQETARRGILPVAGSTPGAFQAQFKTSIQLHNRAAGVARGVLVFHPNGRAAQDDDPRLAYEIAPRQTVAFDDIIAAMGATGIGSIDLIAQDGPVPAVVARAFDDHELGTSGATIPLLDPRDALRSGVPGSLIVPHDLDQFRFNLGVRSLAEGATVRFVVSGANGIERFTAERTLAPDVLEQMPAADMLGASLLGADSIAVEVLEGEALVYGTTTDNVSNDPSVQTATRVEISLGL